MNHLKTKKEAYQDYLNEIASQEALVDHDFKRMEDIDKIINRRKVYIEDLKETAKIYAPEN